MKTPHQNKLKTIDLPVESAGSLCLLCDVVGTHETARLFDPDVGPVCYDCFEELLRVRAVLAFQEVRAFLRSGMDRRADV